MDGYYRMEARHFTRCYLKDLMELAGEIYRYIEDADLRKQVLHYEALLKRENIPILINTYYGDML